MKVLVCGSRNYGSKDRMEQTLNNYEVTSIVHGGATGADSLAGEWAREHMIEEFVYPANWDLYGNRAGYIRNMEMLKEEEPDLVLAFPGGKGTEMMIRLAEKDGVPVVKIDW